MGFESIVLEPDEAENWITALRACGFTILVDEDELNRLGPCPRFEEIPYIVHLRADWVRVLFTGQNGFGEAVLIFNTIDRGCSPYLQFEITKAIKQKQSPRE